MVILETTIPKLPLVAAVQQDGAGADGEINAVTPAGAGKGEALTAAARAARAKAYRMFGDRQTIFEREEAYRSVR